MASIVMIPTGEYLFTERSEEVPNGVKLGLRLNEKVAVSVHLDRANATKLRDALASLCAPPAPTCMGFEPRPFPPGPVCCDRAGEYNGFGSDAPTSFTCAKHCACHD